MGTIEIAPKPLDSTNTTGFPKVGNFHFKTDSQPRKAYLQEGGHLPDLNLNFIDLSSYFPYIHLILSNNLSMHQLMFNTCVKCNPHQNHNLHNFLMERK